MNKLISGSKLFLKRNSSTILTCVGAAGVVATTIMAVKATPKAEKLLEQAKEEKGEELTTIEKIQVAVPVYIPTIAMGASTIACIFGANVLNKRSQASVAAAYALLDNSYKGYKEKVKELYGDDADQEIINEIARDEYEENEFVVSEGKVLYFDSYSLRYFESTPEEVQKAEYELNRQMVTEEVASLNDFYEMLGIDPIPGGDKLGWTRAICMERYWKTWIDFNHDKVLINDDLECNIIEFSTEPVLDYYNYY